MESIIEDEARPIFDLLDDLRALGIGDDFPIPQIAVIGDQSCGKSSLLEALSGIPFPRGVGLVTRCPTCISMHKSSLPGSAWNASITVRGQSNESFATEEKSSHVGSKELKLEGVGSVSAPSELADRISMLTEQLTRRSNQTFSTDIIEIRVDAPDVPDLTLIDLPGIIRTTTVGQSQASIAEIDALLEHFMRQSKTIILAVIPANQDIATVDVLERAQRLDPMGSRTIGVLTKLDLVDQGAENETLSVVNNVRKPLALGYVMVKNRNQSQLAENVPLSKALADEELFFSSHPIWKHVAVNQRGVRALSKKLTKVLLYRAQEALPDMRSDLNRRIKDVQGKIQALGDAPHFIREADRNRACLQIISRFGQNLRQISEGDYRDPSTQNESDLRIKFHLDTLYQQSRLNLTKSVPEFDSDQYKEYLAQILQELRGRELPGFLSARLLLTAVSCSIEEWRKELEDTFALAVDIYVRATRKLILLIAKQYPRLCAVVESVVEATCSKQFAEILRRTNELFETGGLEAISTDQDLISALNDLRFNRFEQCLREVLDNIQEPPRGAVSNQEFLKQSLREMMGFEYMRLHSIGYGPSVQLEDAKAALKAYWAMAEKRFHASALAAIEQVLLLKGSQQIERQLLELVNSGLALTPSFGSTRYTPLASEVEDLHDTISAATAGLTLADLMSEDPAIAADRAALMEKKLVLETAIKRMDSITATGVYR